MWKCCCKVILLHMPPLDGKKQTKKHYKYFMHKSIRPEATHVYLPSFWDLVGLFSKVESNFFFYHMHLKEMYVFMKIACKTE